VSGKSETVSRIIDGALSALARQGLRKLSMVDVCHEAGIARGTLYRYFKSKDDVLEAIGHHVVQNLAVALDRSIEERPEPGNRVRVVADVLIGTFWELHPELVQVGQLEPAFTLLYLNRVLPKFQEILRDTLSPILAETAAVRTGTVTADQLVDIVIRISVSHYLLPNDFSEALPELLASFIELRTARHEHQSTAGVP
jgi:AcrR family transcriptional regulator